MSLPDFDFSEVLRPMVEAEASDVHITAGFPPAMRDKGKIKPMEGFPRLNAQQTREVVYGILNDDQRKRFENNKQLDFAYAIPGVARFRVNCYFQRGSVSAAFRLVPQRDPGARLARRAAGAARADPANRAASSSSPARPARASRRPWRR